MNLGIYGAGGLGREVRELALQINAHTGRWSCVFFIDDVTAEQQVNGSPVLRVGDIPADTEIVIALGEPALRHQLADKLSADFQLATLIHPDVFVPQSTVIEAGCIVCTGAFISCNVVLGRNSLVQPRACVGHDTKIGQHCVVSSQVMLAGGCSTGDRVFIGMNSAIKEKTAIGQDAIIGMGSAVFNPVSESTIVLGNPARAMRNNDQGKVFKSSPQR